LKRLELRKNDFGKYGNNYYKVIKIKQAFQWFKDHDQKGVQWRALEDVKMKPEEIKQAEYMNTIIDEYTAQGYTLSVRQLYYQLVARAYMENTEKNYTDISKIVTKYRMAGLIDWSVIEDRGRVPHVTYYANSVSERLQDALYSFEVDRQLKQDRRIEVWCEKDALTGILKPVTEYYHVPLLVNKGFGSATAIYQGAERFKKAIREGQDCVLIYLGDHDPSGLNMIEEDIPERLTEFELPNIQIKHIALTMEQIHRYKPPKNPAKDSDTRFKNYKKEHGVYSWEVDALKPELLDSLLRQEIESSMDMSVFKEMLGYEQGLRTELEYIIECQKEIEMSI
jgi:hypothetical protein